MKRQELDFNFYLLIANLLLNIITQYLYIVTDALINWGGLPDGSDLVAEDIG